jgi:thiamine-monophosphate kinase
MNPAVPRPEKALIAEIRRRANSQRSRIIPAGIGDDCAILRIPANHDQLVTTDFSLEGIHFRRDWHPPESVGHRCLARGLSDIAAMGGQPVAAFLSLALPGDLPQAWVTRFTRGLLALSNKYNVPLAGGDTAESPSGILADIIVVGMVPKGKAILRSGAKPGDRIYVTGKLGGSAAAVHAFQYLAGRHPERSRSSGGAKDLPHMQAPRERTANHKPNPRTYPRHFYPDPRLDSGRILREKSLASAMIDLSDGLSTDLAHVCEESGVGAEIDSTLIPRARVGNPAHQVELDEALHGGEDYELLFTAPRSQRILAQIAGIPVTQIGLIRRGKGILLRDEHSVARKLEPQGWEHFRQ